MTSKTINLFYSYSHKDEALRDELEKHLKLLQRQHVIDTWHDRKISNGTEWDKVINKNLDTADIVLLLISADFLASDYCWDIEIQRAMQRHEEKSAVVIPVLLRPCDTEKADFMTLQGLPKNFKPVTTWLNPDEAFTDIAKGIRAVAEAIRTAQQIRQIPVSSAAKALPTKNFSLNTAQFSGKTKIAFCNHLSEDWKPLADYLEITPSEQNRFTAGNEGRNIWVWLENRGRLTELPDILSEINRPDLTQLFTPTP
jgi:hypothetical protein